MEEEKYKIAADYFFRSYKTFIDYIALTNNENMYNILVLKKPESNNLFKITVVIRCYCTVNDISNEFSNNVILTNEEATNLINNIREDFKNSHYIAYSGVNSQTLFQTMQNTKFSLNIKLNSISEYEDAVNFNNKINRDGTRHRALAKN